MEKNLRALKYITLFSAFLLPLNLIAQDQIGAAFKGAPEDASKLTQAYLSPLFKGFGVGLNSGWYTSAKAKSTLRFDLRITGTIAFVPNNDKSFDVNQLGLTSMAPASGANPISPTFSGSKTQGTLMRLNGVPNASSDFNLPKGEGINIVPSPQIQLTVGLPKNIDVSLRYIPKIDMKDYGKVDLFGAGAKVEVLPLILGKTEKLIPLDVAVAVGFTRLNYSLPLDVGNNPNANQAISAKVKGLSADAIISKTIAIFTPFFSLGYQKSKTNLRALGTYEFDVPVTPSTPTGKQTYTDPFTFDQTDVNGLRASLGFQLHLGFFRLYGSYSQAKYGYVNAGIGFGMGK
ncbi:DUF6588 family protein [Pedobacter sp. ASV28]|uniref:DUF6588 family protein n=1 Tax=Pedobacter sp. ASV28 TaxID=2795123 RepID=UPI0018EDF10F|nr:DUF6588 family protein [Pedobacter sp. ASV28]